MTVRQQSPRAGAAGSTPDDDLIIVGAGSRNAKTDIPEMARALAESAANINAEQLERAITACCIYADAIVLSDDIIDRSVSSLRWAHDVPKAGGYFLDAAMIWANVFVPADGFWSALRRYHREYIATMKIECEISAGTRTWESCDEELCLKIARGKNGPVRGIAAIVAALAGEPHILNDLEKLVLGYFVVNQMFDDVRDWREDIRDGNLSLLLRRTSPQRPLPDDLSSVGVRMFAGGHVDYVLGFALEELEELLALARQIGATRYAGLLERRYTQFGALRAQLRADIDGQTRRLGRPA